MPEPSWLVAVALIRGWLLTYLVHSTIVLLGAWVVTRLVSMRPESREVVWKAALFTGILTSALAVGAPRTLDVTEVRLVQWAVDDEVVTERTGAGALQLARLSGGASAARVPAGSEEAVHLAGAAERHRDALHAAALPDDALHVETRIVKAGHWTSSPGGWLLWLWLAGAVVGVGGLVWRGRGLLTVRSVLTPSSPRAHRHLADLVEKVDGGPVPRLWTSAGVDSPCVLPGGTIVLAERCDHDLTDDELRAVLAHEMAHVRRRDPAWAALGRAITAVFWIQPLNRIASREMQHATELVCDDRAVAWTGDRVALARSISRIAEWSFASRQPVPGVPMIGVSGRLSGRVRRILTAGPEVVDSRWRRLLVLTAIVLPLHWAPVLGAPTLVRAAVFFEADEVSAAPLIEAERSSAADGGEGAVVEGTMHIVRVRRLTSADGPYARDP